MYPDFETIRAFAASGKYRTAPVSMEMLSDIRTPIQVLRIIKNISGHCYMLESMTGSENRGRYTFLGYDPKLSITCLNGQMNVGGLRFETGDPGRHIQRLLDEYRCPRLEGLPPFTGGLVGYFSYDYLKYAEPSLRQGAEQAEDTEGFQDVDLMLFDKVIAFDNLTQKITLIVNISLKDPEVEYNRAELELRQMAELIRSGAYVNDSAGRLTSDFRQLFTKEEFCGMVEQAKHHIREGDIFQVVLSNRLEADYEGSLLNFYRIIRTLNPSPYMFYFSGSDLEVAGASPETLVKLTDGVLHTFPLAGTRPRGQTPEEDAALETELLHDEKELAEHNMLVDLGRNDIGRISRFGSVRVESLRKVQRYSHVMHIGSSVRGEIREGKNALDAVDAVLPAGTLSGAPKIRACQIIHDLEQNKRGIYGGAVGYLDLTGNLDTCIAIRIAYKKNGRVFIRSGAGIVADSNPEMEYRECLNKAAAVVTALKEAEKLAE